MSRFSKVSALRREPNSHKAAEPRNTFVARHVASLHCATSQWRQSMSNLHRPCIGHQAVELARRFYLAPPCRLALMNFVEAAVFRQITPSALCRPSARRRKPWRHGASQLGQRGAGSVWLVPAAPAAVAYFRCLASARTALPNPSFKRSTNSVARQPSSAGPAAHFALAAQRAMPSSPA